MKLKRRTIVIISGSAVLLAILLLVGIFVVAPAIAASQNTTTHTTTETTTPTASPTPKKPSLLKALKPYVPAITGQLAQGLHLTPQQLTADLQSGQTLSQIATTQKVSATQLQTLENSAVQNALTQAVTAGSLTRQQASLIMKHLTKNPQLLNHLLTPHKKK